MSTPAWVLVVIAGSSAAAILGVLLTLPVWRGGPAAPRLVPGLLGLQAGGAIVVGAVLGGAALQSWARTNDAVDQASASLLDISHIDGDGRFYALLLLFVIGGTIATSAVLTIAAWCAARPDAVSRSLACAVLGAEVGLGGYALARIVGGSRGAVLIVILAHLPIAIAAMVATWPNQHDVPELRHER